MICMTCKVQMHQMIEEVDGTPAYVGGGIAEGDVYETWEVKICPGCGKKVKEGIDNLTVLLYNLSPTRPTRVIYAAPPACPLCGAAMTPPATPNLYKHHRFPGEIISHAVWLYFRFPLSHRDVEELLFVRGLIVSYEAIRKWCRKFGQQYTNQPRQMAYG
jgi:hypothetical protein